ncbi:MAG: molybdate ABC transporter substrate-binding protein, partial [Nocardioidaceae bacterium]
MRRLAVAVLVTASLVLSLGACSDDNDLSGGDSTLTVFAASSLTESFGSLKKAFEDQHPDADVVLSFGSSTTLAEQIVADAPADLIATANKTSVSIVQKADMLAAQPTEFATNTLVIVTPPDNPAHITRLSDLSSADFIMCDPSAPCGAASKEMLANAGITA